MDFVMKVWKLGQRVFTCYRLQLCLVRNKLNLRLRFLLNLMSARRFPTLYSVEWQQIVNDGLQRV
jgi:hypothetical protein